MDTMQRQDPKMACVANALQGDKMEGKRENLWETNTFIERGWASQNPGRAMAYLYVVHKDSFVVDEILQLGSN